MGKVSEFLNSYLPHSIAFGILFALAATLVLSINSDRNSIYISSAASIFAYFIIALLITSAMGLYIYNYEPRIIKKFSRTTALCVLMIILLTLTKGGALTDEWMYLSTGTAVTSAMILSITYNQQTALVISVLYAVLASFAVSRGSNVEMMLTMMTGVFGCCFNMKEIRTRMKLIQVSAITALLVFCAAFSVNIINHLPLINVFQRSGSAALVTLAVGLIIQGFLPIIERLFGVVTSMTLIDYSDANQPLLRKLAMGAPGTFSHSLLVGTIAEKAAEEIGVNGLLCRVGAYYHDIGKVNKPDYFYENQMGGYNRHDQLSPTMSKHVIVGHVKDGAEIAKEYKLPSAIRQFIETHHGRTLIKYFYEEARKQDSSKNGCVNEQDYRYPGPYPQTKEAAIVMLADSVEGAVRAMQDPSASKIRTLIHNMAMERLQDGQFDDCDLTLKELRKIVEALAKSLIAHHHARIAYPESKEEKKNSKSMMYGKGPVTNTAKEQTEKKDDRASVSSSPERQ
jgi:putative nucleotidyltransferase with HDIG domain